MVALIQNIALALIWAALTGNFGPANLLLGFAVGMLLLWLGRRVTGRKRYFEPNEPLPGPREWLTRAVLAVKFVVIFTWEVILANINIAIVVLSPKPKMEPGIIALPLDVKTDGEITLLANMITLTPGTLSLDVSNDRKILYVHAVHASDPEKTKREIKEGFETLVHEVFGR